MKKIKYLLSILFIIYLGFNIYLYIKQDKLIFKNHKAVKKELIDKQNVKEITYKINEEVVLKGKYKKANIKEAPLVIYFGGSSSDITSIFNQITNIKNYNILSFNYRGYVDSTGYPSEKNLYSDALSIYDKYAKNKDVIIIGKSLGTGIATFLANKRKVKGLILITPYDSINSIAKKKYPILPISLLLKHKFESIKYVQTINIPIALMEVKNDTVIKKYHFDKFKEKTSNIFSHLVFENISHAGVIYHNNFGKELKIMLDYIK